MSRLLNMSRIGKKIIEKISAVTLTSANDSLVVKGPKGELEIPFPAAFVELKDAESHWEVLAKNESKAGRARHGLYRMLLFNAIEGVSNGFTKSLEIRGVGYRVAIKGEALELNLGYSHPINFSVPAGVTIVIDKENSNVLHVSGIDKQIVGQTCARLRSLRKPEPYKGKGVRYLGEVVPLKAGKSAKA